MKTKTPILIIMLLIGCFIVSKAEAQTGCAKNIWLQPKYLLIFAGYDDIMEAPIKNSDGGY